MTYNIKNIDENTSLNPVLKKELDSRLVNILTALVDAASHTISTSDRFEAKMEENFDELKEIYQLLSSIGGKSKKDLDDIAKRYGIDNYEVLKKDELLGELTKVLCDKRDALKDASLEFHKSYPEISKNTMEYFTSSNIKKLEDALLKEHNIDLKNKYVFLLNNFKALDSNLKIIHSWVNVISHEVDVISDKKDDFNNVNFELTKPDGGKQFSFALNNDYNSLVHEYNIINSYRNDKKILQKEINEHESKLLEDFASNNIQINFSLIKVLFFENLVNIKENIEDVYNKGVIDIDSVKMDNYINAFNDFFYEIIINEFEFRNYLDDNGIELEGEVVNVICPETLKEENKEANEEVKSSEVVNDNPNSIFNRYRNVQEEKEETSSINDNVEPEIVNEEVTEEQPQNVEEKFEDKEITVEPQSTYETAPITKKTLPLGHGVKVTIATNGESMEKMVVIKGRAKSAAIKRNIYNLNIKPDESVESGGRNRQ